MGEVFEYLVRGGVPTNFASHCSPSLYVKYHDLIKISTYCPAPKETLCLRVQKVKVVVMCLFFSLLDG